MRLAIDIGNTHTVFGYNDGESWQIFRRHTDLRTTEDEIQAWLRGVDAPRDVSDIVFASVVPAANEAIERWVAKWAKSPLFTLRSGPECAGLRVTYDPPTAVGADRIANALGALALYPPPLVIVDFGTATTFDTIDAEGNYVGGAIMPGPQSAAQALASGTAKLPQIEFSAPDSAIGRNTVSALRSGLVLGYAGAIESLAARISEELGGEVTIISTGGLGEMFGDLCPSISAHYPTLTLDGLLIAADRQNRASDAKN